MSKSTVSDQFGRSRKIMMKLEFKHDGDRDSVKFAIGYRARISPTVESDGDAIARICEEWVKAQMSGEVDPR